MKRIESPCRWIGIGVVGLFVAGLALADSGEGQDKPPTTAPQTQDDTKPGLPGKTSKRPPTPDQKPGDDERPGLPGKAPKSKTGQPEQTPPKQPSTLDAAQVPSPDSLLRTRVDPPLGFTGPSGIAPRETQQDSHFVPVEDRWRVGFPDWDRYDKNHPLLDDYPYEVGHWWDPYHQNVLKGDYPIIGQHTFLNLTGLSETVIQYRQIPTPANGFESTERPGSFNQFGKPNQFVASQTLSLTTDLFHGDAAFKPVDWRIHFTPTFNYNHNNVEEVGIVSTDVHNGTVRDRTWIALQDWFVEAKLADLSPDYDFVSARVGSQPFDNDFRGFLFDDVNRGARIFGTRLANRDQFNLAYFWQLEKDTNSELNTFADRHQNIALFNYYRQDFLFPGYTAQFSVVHNEDNPTFHFDKNGFLVRPDPVGVFTPHRVDVTYLGWAGDGHIGRFNIQHQLYWAFGRDSLNPIANQPVNISAEMAAIELSYDRDYMRFRSSFFYASGDSNPNNKEANGFDAILDNPNFAGGEFSYWQRQPIKLLGVSLKNPGSLLPDLRSSKTEGQSNFVNPGLLLGNFGVDICLTPKLKMINNANLLWFDQTPVLETFLFQSKVHHFIGTDLSSGFEYRPLLSNNVVMTFGVSTLIPGQGFSDIYNNFRSDTNTPLFAGFMELVLKF
jgi:hypothetical protein